MNHTATRTALGTVVLALVGSVCACGVAPEMDASVEGGLDAGSTMDASAADHSAINDARSAMDAATDARRVDDVADDARANDVAESSPDAAMDGVADATADAASDVASESSAEAGADAAIDVFVDAARDTGLGCVAPSRLCGGACVDVTSSPLHCGACDSPCAAGRVCRGGTCGCPASTKLCGGACVADNNPATGCAAATCAACSVANATAGCAAGACSIATCAAGFGDCNASAADGCESNTNTNAAHCGACGNVCGPSATCVSGACRPTNDRCASSVLLGSDPYNQTFAVSFRGATGEVGDCSGAGGGSVFYRVNITRPALFYAMVQSNTIFTPTLGLATDCAVARACQTGACGDTRTSQVVLPVDPGPVVIEVGRIGGGDGDATLVVSAIPIPARGSGASATGAITFDIGVPRYDRLNMFDAAMPQLQTSCGGATPTPAFSLYWTTCPSAPAGTMLSMNTCTAERSFDTVLEYRDARGRVECNDDDTVTAACAPTGPGVGYGSSVNTLLNGGPNLHVVTLRQRSGAGLGTANVRWRITGG